MHAHTHTHTHTLCTQTQPTQQHWLSPWMWWDYLQPSTAPLQKRKQKQCFFTLWPNLIMWCFCSPCTWYLCILPEPGSLTSFSILTLILTVYGISTYWLNLEVWHLLASLHLHWQFMVSLHTHWTWKFDIFMHPYAYIDSLWYHCILTEPGSLTSLCILTLTIHWQFMVSLHTDLTWQFDILMYPCTYIDSLWYHCILTEPGSLTSLCILTLTLTVYARFTLGCNHDLTKWLHWGI